MKRLLLVGLFLTSCSLVGGVTSLGKNDAVQSGQTITVTNNLTTTLDQNTLALTGSDSTFKVTPRDKSVTCTLRDTEYNIWGCNLGVLNPKDFKVLDFTGTFLSGNLFSYEKGTGRFIPNVVKSK